MDEEINAEKIDYHSDITLTVMIFSACIYAFMYSFFPQFKYIKYMNLSFHLDLSPVVSNQLAW